MRHALTWTGVVVLVLLTILIGLNWNGLDDGLFYLQDLAAFAPTPPQPLDPGGRFGFCEQFVTLRNAQRARFIENYLDARGIAFERVPIYDTKFDNLFVPFRAARNGTDVVPYTIFSAHYDKFFDEPDYQGASDNSAAVCMLLVAAEEVNRAQPRKPVAILFTGEEERGLVGAKAFYEYATQNGIEVAEILNFDNLGRGGLASRASGERSGYAFTLPLWGEWIYDGRTVEPALPYRQPDAKLIEQIRRLVPFTPYDRMIAQSDGTYWQDQGWNAVNLTSDDIYFLDVTWHTYGDRVELLDQGNLQRALDLVTRYAQLPQ